MARDKTVASAYSLRHTGLVPAPFAWDELATIEPNELTMTAFRARWDAIGDPHAGIDEAVGGIEATLERVARDEANGLGDAPWPPHYPKQPGEPPRVHPSRRKTED